MISLLTGPRWAKKCLRLCAKSIDSDSSRACAKSHPCICSSLIYSIVSNESVSGQQRPWSDCADAQADLGLRSPHISEDKFSHAIWMYYLGRVMRKRVFKQIWAVKAKISLRIRAVWSGPSLSAARIIGYYRMYQQRAKARMSPCACAGWCESALFVHARRHFFSWRGLFVRLSRDIIFWTLLFLLPNLWIAYITVYFLIWIQKWHTA